MQAALEQIVELRERERTVAVSGNREFNPGWHTAMDLHNLLTVSEAVARAGFERRESRGAHFREDHPAKDESFGQVNIVLAKGEDGNMTLRREPLRKLPAELHEVIEEEKS